VAAGRARPAILGMVDKGGGVIDAYDMTRPTATVDVLIGPCEMFQLLPSQIDALTESVTCPECDGAVDRLGIVRTYRRRGERRRVCWARCSRCIKAYNDRRGARSIPRPREGME
jgi:hypothetical protein